MSDISTNEGTDMRMTGFMWEAAIFLTIWEELQERLDEEQVEEIMKKAMHNAGTLMGKYAASKTGKSGIPGIQAAWELFYGPQEVLESSSQTYTIRGTNCAACNLWQAFGLPKERIEKLADLYCIADAGFAYGIDPSVKLVHERRLMKGDSECRWAHSVE